MSSELPVDLSDQVSAWLNAALLLTEQSAIPTIAAELKKLATRHETPGFQLAFVGEFSRGKSMLLNRLLKRSLLPTGALPTTATITSLVAGTEEQMEVCFSDGRREKRPLEESAWNDLTASSNPEQEQETVAQVRLTVDDPWLRELDAEVIDTPGINDLTSYHAARVSELLSQSDAAVFLISALYPLSLTEATFLEQEVMGRHIARIIAVISMLDTFSTEQRAEIFQTATERVAHVSPLIATVAAHPIEEGISEEEVLETLRQQITSLLARSERRAWRSRQIATLLAGYLGQLVQISRSALEMEQLDRAAHAEAMRKVGEEIHLAELHWEKLRQEFEERRLLFDAQLRERLQASTGTLIETATVDLNRASNPKVWWEQTFPVNLRRAFFQIGRENEAWLLEHLSQDIDWLENEAAQEYNVQMELSTPTPGDALELPLHLQDLVLVDVEQRKLLLRLGTSAVAVAGFLLFGPVGGAVSIINTALQIGETVIGNEVVNLAASPFFQKKADEQKRLLRIELQSCIKRSFEEYTSRISERLRELYAQVIHEMKQEQTLWLAARRQALEGNNKPPTSSATWPEILEAAGNQQRAILTALAKQQ